MPAGRGAPVPLYPWLLVHLAALFMRLFATCISFLVGGSLLLPVAAARAQAAFGMGARVGLNVATVPFRDAQRAYSTAPRAGAEFGFVFDFAFGHVAVQPALQFSQKGFTIKDTYSTTDRDAGGAPQTTTTTLNEEYRLDYLTLPVNLTLSLRPNGQGLQAFAGPYLGALLTGSFTYDDRRQVTAGTTVLSTSATTREGDVAAGNYYSNSNSDQKFYSRGLDTGLQAGLGYRKKGFVLQAGYCWGLRNLGADYQVSGNGQTQTSPGPSYYNRAFQVALSYLASPKN